MRHKFDCEKNWDMGDNVRCTCGVSQYSTDELRNELKRRGEPEPEMRCPTCGGKWPVYMGCSRSWVSELHCFGCRKPVAMCYCSH